MHLPGNCGSQDNGACQEPCSCRASCYKSEEIRPNHRCNTYLISSLRAALTSGAAILDGLLADDGGVVLIEGGEELRGQVQQL
jgi:hypothetical protein